MATRMYMYAWSYDHFIVKLFPIKDLDFSPKSGKLTLIRACSRYPAYKKTKQPLCETFLDQLIFQHPQIDVRPENNVFLEGVNKLERYS